MRGRNKPLIITVDGMKLCSRCEETKELEHFGIDRNVPSGRKNWCKPCVKAYQAENKGRVYGVRSIPETAHKKVIELYLEGRSYQEIADIFGASRDTVGNILKANDIKPRAAKRSNHVNPEEGSSYCPQCDRIKDLNKFGPDPSRKNGRYAICIECKRNLTRTRKYNITNEEFYAMKEAQDEKCAICQVIPQEKSRQDFLVIDHCHETNKVRGLLCDKCNRGLGMLGDTTEGILRALKYLLKTEEKSIHSLIINNN